MLGLGSVLMLGLVFGPVLCLGLGLKLWLGLVRFGLVLGLWLGCGYGWG